MKDNFLVSSDEQDVDGLCSAARMYQKQKIRGDIFSSFFNLFLFLYYSYDYLIWSVGAGNTAHQRYKYSNRCSIGIFLQYILSTILSRMNALRMACSMHAMLCIDD
jgi:hypothetical protein